MADEADNTTYIIETRSSNPRDWAGDGWHSDGMGDGHVLAESETEAQDAIARLRELGPDWAAAEYRYRPIDSRELVRMVRAKGGAFAELATHLDGMLDEVDQRAVRQARSAR